MEEVGMLGPAGELRRVPWVIPRDSMLSCAPDGLRTPSPEIPAIALLRTGGAMGPKGDPYEAGQGDRLLSGVRVA